VKGKVLIAMVATLLIAVVFTQASRVGQAANGDAPKINLALNQAVMASIPPPADDPLLDATGRPVLDASGKQVSDPNEKFHRVIPYIYDPYKTHLVQSTWLDGIGCPTAARTALYGPPPYYPITPGTYTDLACPTGDPKDTHNEGLLLVKTGPTGNVASAAAELKKVRGTMVTELGYDIRKFGGTVTPNGSHCGAGAPRFNVITSDATWFVGCSSPPATSQTVGNGYTRLRWGVGGIVYGFKGQDITSSRITGTVSRIVIIFDEGYDVGGDFFGAAILDNIDYNGILVGRGPVGPGLKEDPAWDDDDDD
jgi:hypothetical protein